MKKAKKQQKWEDDKNTSQKKKKNRQVEQNQNAITKKTKKDSTKKRETIIEEIKNQKPTKKRTKVNVGDRINNFILIKYLGDRYWDIKCDCGNIVKVRRDHIERRKSCGCLQALSQFRFLTKEHVITNVKINHYKQSAKARNLEWNLTNDEFYNLIICDCNYCGSPPQQLCKTINHSLMVNGVDRVDSELGYLPTNVVPCCTFCNLAKSNKTVEEFNGWIERLIKFKTKEYENMGH